MQNIETPSIPIRPPSEVMKLERLGSFHPTRLSFTRVLVRRMNKEGWRIHLHQKNLDENGYGHLIYLIDTPSGLLSFIAYSDYLDKRDRTDRVIAEKWDMAFTLFNGVPTDKDIARLNREIPKQEAGRMSGQELVMSRANKSVRLFNRVIECLSSGHQPPAAEIAEIGYLIRTTAVYGNGKFGLMDYEQVKRMTPFGPPFQAEMLTVFLARQLSFDVIDHIATAKGGSKAVTLSRKLKRSLGVGNATGLGMAPFLIGHPQLIHQWLFVREFAISRVKSIECIDPPDKSRFDEILNRVRFHLVQWKTTDERQSTRIRHLTAEIEKLSEFIVSIIHVDFPWKIAADWAIENTSFECQELLNSIMLEIYPDLINELDQHFAVQEFSRLDAGMSVEKLRLHIEDRYAWVFNYDFDDPRSNHFFWYVSEEKEEPRIGLRYLEEGSKLESRIGIARDVSDLYQNICELNSRQEDMSVAEFLLKYPNHRFIVTRIHSLIDYPFAEIQDNLIGKECLPIDILRCKLSIFGANRFDPKSNLWTRITLFQGAPLIDEVEKTDADDWSFPSVDLQTIV